MVTLSHTEIYQRTRGLLRGLRRTPAHTLTHTHTQAEWKPSHHFKSLFICHFSCPASSSPLSFFLSSHVISLILLCAPSLHRLSCYLFRPYFFPLPLFFINFWLSLASIPGGVVWNARHFWATAKQMQAPLLSPTVLNILSLQMGGRVSVVLL